MTIPSIPDLLRLMEENQAQSALIEKLGEALNEFIGKEFVPSYMRKALLAYNDWKKKGAKP